MYKSKYICPKCSSPITAVNEGNEYYISCHCSSKHITINDTNDLDYKLDVHCHFVHDLNGGINAQTS